MQYAIRKEKQNRGSGVNVLKRNLHVLTCAKNVLGRLNSADELHWPGMLYFGNERSEAAKID